MMYVLTKYWPKVTEAWLCLTHINVNAPKSNLNNKLMYVLLEQFYFIRPEQCFFVYKNKDQVMINLKAFLYAGEYSM